MKYDLGVIGGGPAGYTAALEAVKHGLLVAVFEKDRLGGTCLNRGCVPTKFLSHTAELYDSLGTCQRYGICPEIKELDYHKTLDSRNNITDRLRDNLSLLMAQNKIDVISSAAVIMDKNHIKANDEIFEVDNILVSTGSVCAPVFAEKAINSDQLLKLEHIPKSLKIIGGGVVAVEFAYIFSSLGSEVSMYVRGERILRKLDKELAQGLAYNLKKHGVKIFTKCDHEKLTAHDAEVVLSAVGRCPNTDGLPSELFDFGEDGGIVVNEYGMTRTNGIYAAGDVTFNSVQLAHIAMEQGKRVVEHICGMPVRKPYSVVGCIYTSPEAAYVGLSEKEAKSAGMDVVSSKQPMGANARTMIASEDRGFIKLVAQRDTRKIIGAQLLCERASDIISEIALAVNEEMTVDEFTQSVRPHPSFCEELSSAAEILVEKLKA